MTPKEKADQLYRYYIDYTQGYYNCKECCLIAVDEIIKQWEYVDIHVADLNSELNPNLKYWYEVKQEIENL